MLRRIIIPVLCLLPSAAIAAEGTRISIDYGVLAISAEGGPSGVAKHHLSIVLNPDKSISENYEGGGRHPISSARSKTLGTTDEGGSGYQVIDEHTIRRVQQNTTYTQTVTITVSGNSCAMDMQWQLKPGAKYFVSFSQTLGRPAQYERYSLAYQRCTIQ